MLSSNPKILNSESTFDFAYCVKGSKSDSSFTISVFCPYVEHDEEKINFFTPAFLESSASLTVD